VEVAIAAGAPISIPTITIVLFEIRYGRAKMAGAVTDMQHPHDPGSIPDCKDSHITGGRTENAPYLRRNEL
jgi:hypothetical protein